MLNGVENKMLAPPENKALPAGGDKGGFPSRSELRIWERAVKENWKLKEEAQDEIIGKLTEAVSIADVRRRSGRWLTTAGSLMVAMRNSNLAAYEFADRASRLDGGQATENVRVNLSFADSRHPTSRPVPEATRGHLEPGTNGHH